MARNPRGKAQRKATHRYPSVRVQGPSSYVEFQKPTWQEIREAVGQIREDSKKLIRRAVNSEKGVYATTAEGTTVQDAEDALSDMLWDLAIDKFLSWNWVDDDGEPLPPLPEIEQGDLLGDEIQFIFKTVQQLYMIVEDSEGN